MTRPRLVFAHANGFTGASYRRFLEPLARRFELFPLDRLGHDPAFPVSDNWPTLRDEVLTQVQRFDEPVIGVGHSMGGLLMLMAAAAEPQAFRCVVMLDSPLMVGRDAIALRAAKRLGLADRVTPAGRSRGRRTIWPDHDAMGHYLRRRGLFSRFTPEALEDYIHGATRQLGDGSVELIFETAVEVAIFRHLPDRLHGLSRRLEVPSALLAGQQSELMTPARRQRLRRHGLEVCEVPGGHMLPMEEPQATREALVATIDHLLKGTR